jgi:DUF438 domain-containing protein
MSELIDNRAHRIRTMKALVRRLHDGEDPDTVRAQLRMLIGQSDASEVAAMEHELLDEGVEVHELMGMCDLHSNVVGELLTDRPRAAVPNGHPVDVFRRENVALREQAAKLDAVFERWRALPDGTTLDAAEQRDAQALFAGLMDVDKHYSRKENLLFPILERYGITGPSKVMWGKDDEVRELLRALGEALSAKDITSTEWALVHETVAAPALAALDGMVDKEELILLPLSLQTLTEGEWGEIWTQSPEIGWCLIDPEGDYRAPRSEGPTVSDDALKNAEQHGIALHDASRSTSARGSALVFPSGSLDLEQLRAIFSVLPVDLTFVDADDRVRFFTEGADRVFVRPKAIIGRKVEHCHPPGSVHIVQQIVDDFRSARQDMAEFWIELGERFVHIRYYAVRDPAGTYLGTLEVTQDISHQRALTGERRLLAYD